MFVLFRRSIVPPEPDGGEYDKTTSGVIVVENAKQVLLGNAFSNG